MVSDAVVDITAGSEQEHVQRYDRHATATPQKQAERLTWHATSRRIRRVGVFHVVHVLFLRNLSVFLGRQHLVVQSTIARSHNSVSTFPLGLKNVFPGQLLACSTHYILAYCRSCPVVSSRRFREKQRWSVAGRLHRSYPHPVIALHQHRCSRNHGSQSPSTSSDHHPPLLQILDTRPFR